MNVRRIGGGGHRIWRGVFLLAAALALSGGARADEPTKEEPSDGRKIYAFQHRLLPRWTHGSKGAFYRDLRAGKKERLIEAAEEFVGKEFAQGIVVRALPDAPQVLIEFPKPDRMPNCYFALVIEKESGFRYVTLELTAPGDERVKTFVGEWTAEGAHLNFGPRDYTDSDSFLKEFAPKKDGAPAPTPKPEAITRPPDARPAP